MLGLSPSAVSLPLLWRAARNEEKPLSAELEDGSTSPQRFLRGARLRGQVRSLSELPTLQVRIELATYVLPERAPPQPERRAGLQRGERPERRDGEKRARRAAVTNAEAGRRRECASLPPPPPCALSRAVRARPASAICSGSTPSTHRLEMGGGAAERGRVGAQVAGSGAALGGEEEAVVA